MIRKYLFLFNCAVLGTFCEAQQLDYTHWTSGETAVEHQRPLSWKPYGDRGIQIANGELLIDYDFEIVNPGAVPEVVLGFDLYTDRHPWIQGGNDGFHGACWGADSPRREYCFFPLATPVVVPPGQSVAVSGRLDLDGVDGGWGTDPCYVSDGVHGDQPGYIGQFPPPGEAQGVDVRAFSGNSLTVIAASGSGAVVVSHEYDLGVTYSLPAIGTPICSSVNLNSANSIGTLEVFGFVDSVVEDSLLVLRVTNLPVGDFGYFLLSESGAPGSPLGAGLGTLCVGQPLYRWHESIGVTDTTGERTVFLPMVDLPIPNEAIAPGEAWFFQYWHRDAILSYPTSNTTGSVSVNF